MTDRKLRVLLLAALVAGCTTSDPSATPAPETGAATAGAEASPALPSAEKTETATAASPDGTARLVVFRGNTFGLLPNLTKPTVYIGTEDAGACQHTTVIDRDLPAGSYDLTMTTDVQAKLSLTLVAGQTVYVRCNILPIGVVLPAPALDVVSADKVPERAAKLLRP